MIVRRSGPFNFRYLYLRFAVNDFRPTMQKIILVFLILYFVTTFAITLLNENMGFANFSSLEAPEIPTCQISQALPAERNYCRIRVGIINSFTDRSGACFSGGMEHKRGYELALEEITEIDGCLLELVQIDDVRSNSRTRDAVVRLAATDVPLILGAYASGATSEAADEADRQRIPLIVPSASSELITTMGYT